MVLRQRAEGRCEVENQYTRVVRPEGNPRALAAIEETMEPRETFEWRGLGSIPWSALQLRPVVRRSGTPRRASSSRVRVARPEGVPVRRGARRRDQAVRVQGLRHRVHAGEPARHVHGLGRGRVRRVLQLRPRPGARRPLKVVLRFGDTRGDTFGHAPLLDAPAARRRRCGRVLLPPADRPHSRSRRPTSCRMEPAPSSSRPTRPRSACSTRRSRRSCTWTARTARQSPAPADPKT